MAYTSQMPPDERADLIRAYALAAEAKTLVDRLFDGADPDLKEEMTWTVAAAHDLASELGGIVANTEPMTFIDRDRVVLTTRELL